MPATCICTAPAGDALLCHACIAILERALAESPFLDRQLDVVITRQTVYRSRLDGGRSTTQPIPFHVAASDTSIRLRHNLDRWARTFGQHYGRPGTAPVRTSSAFLIHRLNKIAHNIHAHDIHHDILEPVIKARWLIDRPADRWYAGPCDCGTELYATTGRGNITCRMCKATYDIHERRNWLLAAAEDQLATAAVVARAVSWLGSTPLTPTLIRVWDARGRLTAKGHEPLSSDPTKTRPLYRVGDVIDLVTHVNEAENAGSRRR